MSAVVHEGVQAFRSDEQYVIDDKFYFVSLYIPHRLQATG